VIHLFAKCLTGLCLWHSLVRLRHAFQCSGWHRFRRWVRCLAECAEFREGAQILQDCVVPRPGGRISGVNTTAVLQRRTRSASPFDSGRSFGLDPCGAGSPVRESDIAGGSPVSGSVWLLTVGVIYQLEFRAPACTFINTFAGLSRGERQYPSRVAHRFRGQPPHCRRARHRQQQRRDRPTRRR
jgi:hypothetical protein